MPARINSGFTTLLSKTVTTAETAATTASRSISANTTSLTVLAKFTYGSGGTTAKYWLQTSFDNGTTWMDIACFAATTASKTRTFTLTTTAVTTLATPADGTTGDDTCVNGFIGPLIRVKYTTAGTYAASTTVVINVVPKE